MAQSFAQPLARRLVDFGTVHGALLARAAERLTPHLRLLPQSLERCVMPKSGNGRLKFHAHPAYNVYNGELAIPGHWAWSQANVCLRSDSVLMLMLRAGTHLELKHPVPPPAGLVEPRLQVIAASEFPRAHGSRFVAVLVIDLVSGSLHQLVEKAAVSGSGEGWGGS